MSTTKKPARERPQCLCAGYGTAFREIRERRKLSQKDVAKYLGVTQSAVAQWEDEKRAPSEFLVDRLAFLYSVSMGQLGWRQFEYIDLKKLTPAIRGKPGHFLSPEEKAAIDERENLRKAEKEQLRLAAIKAKEERLEQTRLRNIEYQTKAAVERREAQRQMALEKKIVRKIVYSTLSADEKEDEFWRLMRLGRQNS